MQVTVSDTDNYMDIDKKKSQYHTFIATKVNHVSGKRFLLTVIPSVKGVAVLIGDVPRRGLRRTSSVASNVPGFFLFFGVFRLSLYSFREIPNLLRLTQNCSTSSSCCGTFGFSYLYSYNRGVY